MPFAPPPSSRPLSLEEINGLKVNTFMPVFAIAIIAMMIVIIGGLIVVPMWNSPFVKWFAGAAIVLLLATSVFVWMHVRNNLGDLRDGVAQVRTGRLISKRRTYGDAPYTHYATIEGAGEVIVWGADWDKMVEQQTYTIAFSPRTRRTWTVEPLNPTRL